MEAFGKYLGIYINSKLTWSDHCKLTASKATRILNILRRTIFGCSAHRSIQEHCQACMEYACVVWNPHVTRDCTLLMRSKITLQGGL